MLSFKSLTVSGSLLLFAQLQQHPSMLVAARKTTGLPTRPVSEMDTKASLQALSQYEQQLRTLAANSKDKQLPTSDEKDAATHATNKIGIQPRGARGTSRIMTKTTIVEQTHQDNQNRDLSANGHYGQSSSTHYGKGKGGSGSKKGSKKSKKSGKGKGYYGEADDDGNSHIIGAGFSKFSFSFAAILEEFTYSDHPVGLGSIFAFSGSLATDEYGDIGRITGSCTVTSGQDIDLTTCDMFLSMYTDGYHGQGVFAASGPTDTAGGRLLVTGSELDFAGASGGILSLVFDPVGNPIFYMLMELN